MKTSIINYIQLLYSLIVFNQYDLVSHVKMHWCIVEISLISPNSVIDSVLYSFQDKVLISQWKDEIINGHKLSAQIVASMTTKASKMYGAAITNSPSSENFKPPLEHRNSNGS